MGKSVWRRNDLIYMPIKKEKKKKESQPTGQGEIFALMATGNALGDVPVVGNLFKGYQSFSVVGGSVNNYPTYKHSGFEDIDVLMWKDYNGASGIESLIWRGGSKPASTLLFIPPTGSDLYLIMVNGASVFTSEISTITLNFNATTAIPSHTYKCNCFNHTMSGNLHSYLQACSLYGSGDGRVLLVLANNNSVLNGLSNDSLLSLANCVLKYYQTGQTVNNLISV